MKLFKFFEKDTEIRGEIKVVLIFEGVEEIFIR